MSEREPINTWDQMRLTGGDRIGIFWHGPDYSRSGMGGKWTVIRLIDGAELMTRKDAPWYDYGRKSFPISGAVREDKPVKLAAALAWIAMKFGARVFVRNRSGDYVEQVANDQHPLPKRKRKAKIA